ncbi:MAG: aminotransferase class V-fold PLP-dependent enzyme [Candidatus Bathyarchaeia archaeon]
MLNVEKIRKDFPILDRRKVIYFDNAATSLKPKVVIDALADYYLEHCANIHRGIYRLSEEATTLYEEAHDKVARFVGAKNREEMIFVKNTTEAINFVAYGLDWRPRDKVITTIMEHHSNFVPWQMVRDRVGLEMKVVGIKPDYSLDFEDLDRNIDNRTKLVAITHVSNVLGAINPVKEICKVAHENGALCLIDAAQSVPHMPVNVKDLDADFLAFSAHKMLGPTGVGALYIREGLDERLSPTIGGGDMIESVNLKRSTWRETPWKYEAGTPNIAGGIGFGAAVDYLEKIGMENVRGHEVDLTGYALKKMEDTPNVLILGSTSTKNRAGIVSFVIKGVNAHDLALYLDEINGIAVRSGFHCCEPLHKQLGVTASVRASFYIYNTKKEIDIFCDALETISKELV